MKRCALQSSIQPSMASGPEQWLTFQTITQLTGEQDHTTITEIESIFTSYEEIDPNAFDQCCNLQKLTLLNGRLHQIPSLHSIRHSLVHLCLCAQRITKMESLDLPQLRALYLQQNAIQRIEGLDHCRKLQILWLYGNHINRIENLQYNTNLRELWLQDNNITILEETNSLIQLETLCLAQNKIDSLDQLKCLEKITSLRHISLEDAHFGTNPIVSHVDYQRVMMIVLPQLITLDGRTIQNQERIAIVDAFLEENMAFNDRVAELTLACEHDIRSIETRKQRGVSNATMLQQELIQALNELEHEVMQGQESLERERLRQQNLRNEHCERLTIALDTLCMETHAMIDAQQQVEMDALEEEEEQYELLEQQAHAEHMLALTVATLQCTFLGKIAFQQLPEHAPDVDMIQSHFKQEQGQSISILQVYRFYHQELIHQFYTTSQTSTRRQYLYTVVSPDEAMHILQSGWQLNNTISTSQWLVLFSNPIQAMSFYQGTPGTIENKEKEAKPSIPHMKSYVLLLCHVHLSSVIHCPVDETVLPFTSLNAMIACATLHQHDEGDTPSFLHIEVDDTHIYLIDTMRNDSSSRVVLPEIVVLTSQQTKRKRSRKSIDSSEQPELLLLSFYKAMNQTIEEYDVRLQKEMEPERWRKKTETAIRKQQREREMKRIKSQVAQERVTTRYNPVIRRF